MCKRDGNAAFRIYFVQIKVESENQNVPFIQYQPYLSAAIYPLVLTPELTIALDLQELVDGTSIKPISMLWLFVLFYSLLVVYKLRQGEASL